MSKSVSVRVTEHSSDTEVVADLLAQSDIIAEHSPMTADALRVGASRIQSLAARLHLAKVGMVPVDDVAGPRRGSRAKKRGTNIATKVFTKPKEPV